MAAAKTIRMGDAVSAVSSELDGIYVSTLFTRLFKHSLIKIHLSLCCDFMFRKDFDKAFLHHHGIGGPVCLLLWPPLLQMW